MKISKKNKPFYSEHMEELCFYRIFLTYLSYHVGIICVYMQHISK